MSKDEATTDERSGDRIAKLLARAGVASRREIERMIEAGRIKIGDQIVTTPATLLTSLRGVTVDDVPVKAPEAPRLFAFHKPAGLITAERDAAGRPTIYTALRNSLPPGSPRLMPVGRLDLNTEGLLLLTNDGELKRAMELPSSGIPRTYRARTFGPITQAQLEELMQGIEIEGVRYGPINANMERSTGRNQWIEVVLTEGKNREVRRVLEHLGLQVSRLLRVSYGPFELGDLPRGMVVELRQADVERFAKGLKLAPSTYAPAKPAAPVVVSEEAAVRPVKRAGPARRKPDPSRPPDTGSSRPARVEPQGRFSINEPRTARKPAAPRSNRPDTDKGEPLLDRPKGPAREGRSDRQGQIDRRGSPSGRPNDRPSDRPNDRPTKGPAGGRGKPSGSKPGGFKPNGFRPNR
ncbi:MAG: pseudouridine synthase [Novosphingobium sp.]